MSISCPPLVQSGERGDVLPRQGHVADHMADHPSLRASVRQEDGAVSVGVAGRQLAQGLVVGVTFLRALWVHILWVETVTCRQSARVID